MFFILILVVLAWGAYQFFKYNTKSGVETTRAYVYLEALLNGETKEAAQELASGGMMNLDTEALRHIANELRMVHGGKSLPIVSEAYRQGMTSRMSWWYRWSASQCDPSPSVSMMYTIPLSMKEREPDWVQAFILYFVLGKFKDEPQGTIPGTVLVPADLVDLMDGKVSRGIEYSLPASLRLYMEFAHPNTKQYRWNFLPPEIKQYLMRTMSRSVKQEVIRQTMQTNVLRQSGSPMPEAELDDFMQQVEIHQARGAMSVHLLYGMCMMALTEDEFQRRHGKSYDQFEAEMIAFNNRPDCNDTDSEATILNYQVDTTEHDKFNPELTGQTATFDEFYRIFVAEIKRLSNIPENNVHPVEMMEDELFLHAFVSGTDPKELAKNIHARH
ncbi:hypothetical protein CFBP6625_00475 [Agrobacterium tumefaciens]|nr:hypothetical protein CFBP6625_00475 [Agrobacterium tumefaciens]